MPDAMTAADRGGAHLGGLRKEVHDNTGRQQTQVKGGLPPAVQQAHRAMRIEVSQQQEGLVEDQTGGPHRGSASEPGEHLFGEHRLDKEQQAGTGEDGDREGYGFGRGCW